MRSRIGMGVAVVMVTTLSGCASIVNGSNQVVSVETRNATEQVVGATCRLQNPKGVFYVTTPGTVTIHRAYDDLQVSCEKSGEEPGVMAVKSSTKGMAFGNILFGGVIGAAVDMGSGAAYDYPTLITVLMGKALSAPTPDPAPVPEATQALSTTDTDTISALQASALTVDH